MAYMAVGSRQILFADSTAPAYAGPAPADVANLVDRTSSETEAAAANQRTESSEGTGQSVDVSA